MPQVFLSYKRADADRVAIVRERLEALGVSFFIDLQLQSGENYLAAINEQLNIAEAALVFWSEAAIALPKAGQPNFLMSEAQRAYTRGIMIGATFDKVALDNIPVPFNTFHACDLSGWLDSGMPAKNVGWQKLLEGLGTRIKRPGLPELAIVLESSDIDARRRFLRKYPADPISERFAEEIVAMEREAFESAFTSAQSRIDRRRKESEKILKDCRKEFEAQLVSLRAGKDFWPPDPANLVNDNIAMLNDQLEVYEAANKDLQCRVEQADLATTVANQQVEELNAKIAMFVGYREQAERAAEQIDSHETKISELRSLIARKDATIVERGAAVESLQSELASAKRINQVQSHAISKVEAQNLALRRRLPDEVIPFWTSTRFVAGSGIVAGLVLGFLAFEIVEIAGRPTPIATRGEEQKRLEAGLPKVTELGGRPQVLSNEKRTSEAQSVEQKNVGENKNTSETEKSASEKADSNAQSTSLNSIKMASAAPATSSQAAPDLMLSAAARECDAIAGDEFDIDRPKDNPWKASLSDVATSTATILCQESLRAAEAAGNVVVERRLRVEIARLLTAESAREGKKGNLVDAQRAIEGALEYLKQAAAKGSAQANYVLGTYYRGDLEPKGGSKSEFVPVGKDLSRAWEYFQKSADLGHPVGLTTVAFSLLLPHWTENIAEADFAKGKAVLEAALKSEFPRAYFVLGLAMLEGKGFPKDRNEGLRNIAVAYCKDDQSAQRFVKSNRIKIPACSP